MYYGLEVDLDVEPAATVLAVPISGGGDAVYIQHSRTFLFFYTLNLRIDRGKYTCFNWCSPIKNIRVKSLKYGVNTACECLVRSVVDGPDHRPRFRVLEVLSRQQGLSLL